MTTEQLEQPLVEPGLRRRALPTAVVVVEPRRTGIRAAFHEFWESRRFVRYFGRGFLRKRYARTWLGFLWLPLRPSISVATRLLVFGGLIGISAGKTPYPVFFLIAAASWQLFAEAAYWSTRSLELNRTLLRDIEIPRLVVLAGALVPSIVEFLIYAAIGGAALLYYFFRAGVIYLDISPRSLVLVPGGLLALTLLGLAVGLFTASLGARARDVRFSLTYALSFLYFLTPVIYPLSTIPNKWKPLAEINPLTGAIEMVKDGLFGSHTLSPDAVIVTFVAVVVALVPGVWVFHRRDVAGGA